MHASIFLIALRVRMYILFIVKVKIFSLLNGLMICSFMFIFVSGMVNIFLACSSIIYQHMVFWWLCLDSHPTIHHSIIAACIRSNTGLGTSIFVHISLPMCAIRLPFCQCDLHVVKTESHILKALFVHTYSNQGTPQLM